MDRRSFFRSLRGGGAALGAGAMLVENIPEAKAYEVERGIPSPAEEPSHAFEQLEKKLVQIANDAAMHIEAQSRLPHRVHVSEWLALKGDTINIPVDRFRPGWGDLLPIAQFAPDSDYDSLGNIMVKYDRHVESSAIVRDARLFFADRTYALAYLMPACLSLAHFLTNDSKSKRLLCYGRLPLPILCTGAIAAHGKTSRVSVRLILSYEPDVLAQRISIDMLYGVA